MSKKFFYHIILFKSVLRIKFIIKIMHLSYLWYIYEIIFCCFFCSIFRLIGWSPNQPDYSSHKILCNATNEATLLYLESRKVHARSKPNKSSKNSKPSSKNRGADKGDHPPHPRPRSTRHHNPGGGGRGSHSKITTADRIFSSIERQINAGNPDFKKFIVTPNPQPCMPIIPPKTTRR